jgi:hypothetical protein
MIGTATWATLGKYGKALTFNGTSARVTVNDAASLHLTTGMTLEAWVKPTASQSGWRTVIQKEVDTYFLDASSNSPRRPATGGTFGSTVTGVAAPNAIPVNSWTHLASTYDGANIRLYVNGTQVAIVARTGSIAASTLPVWIGGNNPYGEYFNGVIDEVRIYNRALSVAEIQADMNAPL